MKAVKILWYAVDKNGNGFLYDTKPYRKGNVWRCNSGLYTLDFVGSLVTSPEICASFTWADEPILIEISVQRVAETKSRLGEISITPQFLN